MRQISRSGRRRLVFAILTVVVVVAAAVVVVVLARPARQLAGNIAAKVSIGDRPINILLIANNARGVQASDPLGLGTAAGQADVILLARIDPAAHVIHAITIPRDTLVAQPQWHNSVPKIKTLFFMGDEETPRKGPQYLSQAVGALTGLPIDGYIAINFAGFKEAVDVVGGLTINVKKPIHDPSFTHTDFRAGVQHMNGGQALNFIRVRQNEAGNDYRINDYQRMQDEVMVLGLLRDKLLDPAHASTLIPKFVTNMKRDVATNMPQDLLVRIGIAMAGAPVYQVPLGSIADSMVLARARIPGVNRDGVIDEAAYDVLDTNAVKARLAEFGSRSSVTGLPASDDPHSVHIDLHGSKHLALHLEHLGYTHVRIVGASDGASRVIYPEASPASAWDVARAMGVGNVYVEPGASGAISVYE
ncbi:MAG: LCP family protein [Candidatus Eremiobacteraeota bacterium]|nr:LCP family protein [Candidatus Eremiobacteraeota bacterium]MBV8282851.1 LCP family protein [Candidatus Eremiobacteraeota bacterium]